MIKRTLEQKIDNRFNKGKIILLLGPRQVGKTTLCQSITEKSNNPVAWFNGDEPDVRDIFSNTTSTHLKGLIGKNRLIIIDEAQRIKNIGITLKLLVDNFRDIQVIVTGSSSLELTGEVNEPLTGRKYEFFLYPVSFREMADHSTILEEKRMIDHRLVYGYYPEIVTNPGEEKELLSLLAGSYLYKDLFAWEQIKKPAVLEKLLQALALQLGNEVSYHELGQLVGADNQTIERYVDLLEKAFVIFRLTALSRNLRNELKKSRKIYFFDNFIRNAIIKNFNTPSLRDDCGALWENLMLSGRMKANQHSNRLVNMWFWRTHAQQEIDYIEEYDGRLHAYEFKWSPAKKGRFSKTFLKAYPNSTTMLVTPDNYEEFIYQ